MADATELRRFATEQFQKSRHESPLELSRVQRLYEVLEESPQLLLATERLQGGSRRQDFAALAARLIESFGWQRLGSQLGYFDDGTPVESDVIAALEKFAFSQNSSIWPMPFRDLARQLLSTRLGNLVQKSPIDAFRSDDIDGVAIFQSALVAADQFRDPLVENLSSYLNAVGPPSKPKQPTAKGILLALDSAEAREPIETGGPDFLVAGVVRLVELLSSFETIFPPILENSEVYHMRQEIGVYVTRLLTWRLDLWDQQKLRKLQHLINQFWRVCSEQFPANAVDFEFDISVAQGAVLSLLGGWRTRADIDPSTRPFRRG